MIRHCGKSSGNLGFRHMKIEKSEHQAIDARMVKIRGSAERLLGQKTIGLHTGHTPGPLHRFAAAPPVSYKGPDTSHRRAAWPTSTQCRPTPKPHKFAVAKSRATAQVLLINELKRVSTSWKRQPPARPTLPAFPPPITSSKASTSLASNICSAISAPITPRSSRRWRIAKNAASRCRASCIARTRTLRRTWPRAMRSSPGAAKAFWSMSTSARPTPATPCTTPIAAGSRCC